MQTTTFHRGKVLLLCAFATAAYFTIVILIDYLRIENNVIAAARELFLLPFFLMLIILPFFLLTDLVRKRYDRRILYAVIAWTSTLLLVILKTFFSP